MATAPTTRINDLQTLLNHHADQGDNPGFITDINYDAKLSLVDRTINTESTADAAIGVFSGHKTVANVRLHTIIQELLEKEPDENTLEYKGQTMTAQTFKTALQSQSTDSLNINSIFTTYGARADRPQQNSQAEATDRPVQTLPPGNVSQLELKTLQTGVDSNINYDFDSDAPEIPVKNLQALLNEYAEDGHDPRFRAKFDYDSSQCFVQCIRKKEYQAQLALVGDSVMESAANKSLYQAVAALLQTEPDDETLEYKGHKISVEAFKSLIQMMSLQNYDINTIFTRYGKPVGEPKQSSPTEEATSPQAQALPPGNVSQLKLETLQTGVGSSNISYDFDSNALEIPVRDLQALLNEHAEDGHDPRFRAEFDHDRNQCFVQYKLRGEYRAQLNSASLSSMKSAANKSLYQAVEALLQTEPGDKVLEYKDHKICVQDFKSLIQLIGPQDYDINEIFTHYGEPLGEPKQRSPAEETTSSPDPTLRQ